MASGLNIHRSISPPERCRLLPWLDLGESQVGLPLLFLAVVNLRPVKQVDGVVIHLDGCE